MSAIWAKVHFIRGNVHKHGILSTLLIGQSPINKVDKDPHPPPIKERKAPPINGSESLNIKTLIKKTFTLFIKFEGTFLRRLFSGSYLSGIFFLEPKLMSQKYSVLIYACSSISKYCISCISFTIHQKMANRKFDT